MTHRRRSTSACLLLAIAALVLLAAEVRPAEETASIEAWRKERLQRLTSDDGWLTVAGLFWLEEGDNRAGSGSGSPVRLPGSAPARAGVFRRAHDKVTFTADPSAAVTAGGKPVSTIDLKDDTTGHPDMLVLGDLTMFVIKRGDRLAVRLRDKNRPERAAFKGLDDFPIQVKYRVTAEWVPYDPPRTLNVPNILGTSEPLPCPGYARFRMAGTELRLEPVIEEPGDTQLFFIFADRTNGTETYPSGRFFYADPPAGRSIVLDFNKAYNPPCAFTPFATCPLPPQQNRLAVRIEAGEKTYHAGEAR
jgi:uncharacterized protein (DUF1684 family)